MAPSSGLPDAAAAAARRNRQRIGGQPWFWTSQSDVAIDVEAEIGSLASTIEDAKRGTECRGRIFST
jgi:hypothetical protein